jgi:hypothetical protein
MTAQQTQEQPRISPSAERDVSTDTSPHIILSGN